IGSAPVQIRSLAHIATQSIPIVSYLPIISATSTFVPTLSVCKLKTRPSLDLRARRSGLSEREANQPCAYGSETWILVVLQEPHVMPEHVSSRPLPSHRSSGAETRSTASVQSTSQTQ